MDPESKKLLTDTLELAQENNRMLHSMRRSQKIASFVHVVYWLIIIGVSVGAFYFLQPYADQAQQLWKASSSAINQLNKLK